MKLRKKLTSVVLAVTMVAVLALPVIAQTWLTYYPTIVIDSSGVDRTAVSVITGIEGQALVDGGVLSSTGLDSRMRLAGTDIPYMMSTTQIPTYLATLPALGQSQVDLYTGYSVDQTDFDILSGEDGYITIDDDATLELAADFELEQSGYVDTDAGSDKNLVFKEDAFRTYISAEDSITSGIVGFGDFPSIAAINGGNDVVNQTNHIVNLPAGIVAHDLLLIFFAADAGPTITFPEGWTELFQDDNTAVVTLAIAYRVADGTEGATITVTTSNIQMTAHTTYRITGNWSTPEVGVAVKVTDANPDSPNLVPTWGSANTLWLAVYASDANPITTVYPVNYTDGRNDVANDAEGAGVGSARRELNAANENPGAFTMSFVDNWIATTVAIAPIVEVTATGISSGEYTVKTYGVANEPAWATGDVLHFTGAADSNVNAGAINNNIAKLWVSLWFNLDSTFSAASATDQFMWGKFIDGTHFVYAWLESGNGRLYFGFNDGGVNPFQLISTTVSWTADTWYHIITSLSDTGPAQRLLVNDVAEDTDAVVASNTPNGGDFCFGDYDDPGAVTGFIGEIQNVIIGTDNLTSAEETALFAGTAPGDETDYWYTDEGTGTNIVSYGTAANAGTVDAAPTWATATFTTGSTGRLCDFYIEVDDGVADPDRWGANLQGASVLDNANDWRLNQNNVMPWMDYYYHTVAGVRHAWYQPNYMVQSTSYDGTADAGGTVNTLVDAELVQANDYWNNALLTITDTTDDLAPEGETSFVTDFDAGTDTLTFSPALTVAPDAGDTYTVDFATLIDRSYYGLEFDGVGDVVDCGVGTGNAFGDGVTEITVELWFKADVTNDNDGIFYIGDYAGTQGEFYLQIGGDVLSFRMDNLAFNQGVGFSDVVNWYHIVATYNGIDGKVYLDSTEVISANYAAGLDLTGLKTIIGSYFAAGQEFDGIIDEVRIYNRALQPIEITANYNSGVGSYTPYSTSGILGWWHIETGSGAVATDSSGEGNNGTITNAVWVNGFVPRPAGNGGTNDSRLTWGVNTDITLVYGEPVNFATTSSALSGEGGYTVAEADMPAEWYGTAGNIVNLPLYDMMLGISTDSGIPTQTLYVFFIIALCFAFMIAGFVMFNSVMASIVGVGLGLGIGSAMTVVPMWIFFTFLILAIGIGYLKGRAVLG